MDKPHGHRVAIFLLTPQPTAPRPAPNPISTRDQAPKARASLGCRKRSTLLARSCWVCLSSSPSTKQPVINGQAEKKYKKAILNRNNKISSAKLLLVCGFFSAPGCGPTCRQRAGRSALLASGVEAGVRFLHVSCVFRGHNSTG